MLDLEYTHVPLPADTTREKKDTPAEQSNGRRRIYSQQKMTHGFPHPRDTGANEPGISGDHCRFHIIPACDASAVSASSL
jgi:hypothetical protein